MTANENTKEHTLMKKTISQQNYTHTFTQVLLFILNYNRIVLKNNKKLIS